MKTTHTSIILNSVIALGLFCLASVAFATPVDAQPLINEVFSNPATERDVGEWLEVFNESTTATTLDVWKLNGQSLPAIKLEPYEYAVITKTAGGFKALEPDYAGKVVEAPSLSLSNSGGVLKLEFQGETEEIIFPSLATGEAWQRQGPSCSTWQKLQKSDPGKLNSSSDQECFPASTEGVVEFNLGSSEWLTEATQTIDEQVAVRASLTSFTLAQAWDKYGTPISESFTKQASYQGHVYAKLVDENGNVRVLRSGKLMFVPNIVFNEVLIDPSGVDAGKEFIELDYSGFSGFDAGLVTLRLGGDNVEIAKSETSSGEKLVTYFLEGEVLENCQQPSTCRNLIALMYDGVEVAVLVASDSIAGLSYSRVETGGWILDGKPTPAAVNIKYQKPTGVSIVEIYPSPAKGEEEWVKLLADSQSVDLSGWYITDSSSNQLLAGELVKGKALKVIVSDLTLNNGGEVLELRDSVGSLIDKLEYPATGTGKVFMRGGISSALDSGSVSTDTETAPTVKPSIASKAPPTSKQTIKLETPLTGIQKVEYAETNPSVLAEEQTEQDLRLLAGLSLNAVSAAGVLAYYAILNKERLKKSLLKLLQTFWHWWNS